MVPAVAVNAGWLASVRFAHSQSTLRCGGQRFQHVPASESHSGRFVWLGGNDVMITEKYAGF